MKVYVDKLPKDCWDCPMHDGENGWCKMLVCYTDYIPKDCPLKSLADYTKQVRKEVLGELMNMLGDRAELIDCGSVAEFMFTTYDLQESINEILGETKCQKK